MAKVLLVRHGHVEGISPARFRGRAELPLTAHGEAQARAVARKIASTWKPAIVYTSPLSRCVATGSAIAETCGVTTETLEDLNDIHYGTWQFRTYEEMKKADPAKFSAWFATPHLVSFPEGESLQQLVARTANVLQFVLKQHVHDAVVLVGHDSVNRAILLQLLDQPLSSYWRIAQDPCCINEIDLDFGAIIVRQVNNTSHEPH
jgi:broad specificity phosphatase PhoE